MNENTEVNAWRVTPSESVSHYREYEPETSYTNNSSNASDIFDISSDDVSYDFNPILRHRVWSEEECHVIMDSSTDPIGKVLVLTFLLLNFIYQYLIVSSRP